MPYERHLALAAMRRAIDVGGGWKLPRSLMTALRTQSSKPSCYNALSLVRRSTCLLHHPRRTGGTRDQIAAAGGGPGRRRSRDDSGALGRGSAGRAPAGDGCAEGAEALSRSHRPAPQPEALCSCVTRVARDPASVRPRHRAARVWTRLSRPHGYRPTLGPPGRRSRTYPAGSTRTTGAPFIRRCRGQQIGESGSHHGG
jgi:hypothetical protein